MPGIEVIISTDFVNKAHNCSIIINSVYCLMLTLSPRAVQNRGLQLWKLYLLYLDYAYQYK